jgi:exopolysaccharide production protein ExoQ
VTVAADVRNGAPAVAALPRAAPRLLSQLEKLVTFCFLLTFAQVFWPPDTFFIYLKGGEFGESHFFDTATIVALYVFLGIGAYACRTTLPRLMRVAWPILALCLLALLSAFWSDDPALVVRRTGSVFAATMFGIYLVARGDLGDLVALVVKVYAFAVAGSFAVAVLMPNLVMSTNETYVHAWRGAFTDKNQLGLACGLGIIFSIYALWNRYGPRPLALFTLAGCLVLLKLSESKTPIVVMMAVAYGAVVCGALRRRTGAGALIGFALIVLGLAAVTALAVDPVSALEALGRDPTFTNRTPLWRLAWYFIQMRPWLGYGYDAFWRLDGPEANIIWQKVEWQAPHAHDAWLEMMLGMGIVGISLVILVWLVLFSRFARVATAAGARHAVFCTALTLGVMLENMTEYAFFRRGEILWLLFVVAFVEVGRELADFRRDRAALSAVARGETRRRWRNRRALA